MSSFPCLLLFVLCILLSDLPCFLFLYFLSFCLVVLPCLLPLLLVSFCFLSLVISFLTSEFCPFFVPTFLCHQLLTFLFCFFILSFCNLTLFLHFLLSLLFVCFLSCLSFFVDFLCGIEFYGNSFARSLSWVFVCIANWTKHQFPFIFIFFLACCVVVALHAWDNKILGASFVFLFYSSYIMFSSVGSIHISLIDLFCWWWLFVSGLKVTLLFLLCWLLCCPCVLLWCSCCC